MMTDRLIAFALILFVAPIILFMIWIMLIGNLLFGKDHAKLTTDITGHRSSNRLPRR